MLNKLVAGFLLILSSASAEELKFYSQYEQDKYLYENVFKDKRNGVFVDIGAHDGVSLSNTLFFEKFMGWTGICVEPIPEVFELLRTNRKCQCIQGCIFDKGGNVRFLKVNGYAEMLSGIHENYDPRHLERIRMEIMQSGGYAEIIFVKCYPLMQILLENEIFHIDYLSIDTEGGEWGILESIDFDKIDIDIIDVENNYSLPYAEILEPHGYLKIASIGCDEIYQKIR